MGRCLFAYECEECMLDVMNGFLAHCTSPVFLPTPSCDFLSDIQQWLREKANPTQRMLFDWLNRAEMSADFYNSELVQIEQLEA